MKGVKMETEELEKEIAEIIIMVRKMKVHMDMLIKEIEEKIEGEET